MNAFHPCVPAILIDGYLFGHVFVRKFVKCSNDIHMFVVDDVPLGETRCDVCPGQGAGLRFGGVGCMVCRVCARATSTLFVLQPRRRSVGGDWFIMKFMHVGWMCRRKRYPLRGSSVILAGNWSQILF